MYFSTRTGQATVEGAFLIPIILIIALLLIQPAIVLYDRIIMQNAAAEGCRLLITKESDSGFGNDSFESFIKNRLASIPEQDNFHVHKSGCSWAIEPDGDETSEYVSVTISQEIKLLPFIDIGAAALGITNASGNLPIKVNVSYQAKDSWVSANEEGLDPEAWVSQWD